MKGFLFLYFFSIQVLTSQQQTVSTHILKSCDKGTVVAVEMASCVGLVWFFLFNVFDSTCYYTFREDLSESFLEIFHKFKLVVVIGYEKYCLLHSFFHPINSLKKNLASQVFCGHHYILPPKQNYFMHVNADHNNLLMLSF